MKTDTKKEIKEIVDDEFLKLIKDVDEEKNKQLDSIDKMFKGFRLTLKEI